MSAEKSTGKVQADGNGNYDCFPPRSPYCYLKIRLTGRLNEKDLDGLYKCTLCNACGMAGLNRSARERAVSRDLIPSHLERVKGSIARFGNPYGVSAACRGNGQASCETVLFRGCTPTHKAPEILAAAEHLLKSKGIEYGLLDDETCCGNILFNLGDRAAGDEAVKKNIAKFKAAGVKRIITVCPGCYHAFNKYYKGRDGFNPEVVLAVDLLDGLTFKGDGLVVQDPCHAKEKAPVVRRMLPGVKNKSASPCCGAGAGVMMHDRPLAGSKARKAAGKDGETVVTYCPFCYINLASARPDNVKDIYVLLDENGHGGRIGV